MPKLLTKGEQEFIRHHYKDMTINAIALEIGRAHQTVRRHIELRMGRTAKVVGQKWDAGLDEFLKANRDRGYRWIADRIGRTIVAVRSRCARIGAERPYNRVTDYDILRCLHSQGLSSYEIADQMGVNDETIRCHMIRAGLARGQRSAKWYAHMQRRGGQLHQIKSNLHKNRAADLGWPSRSYCEAVLLSALSGIGRGDRVAIADACGRLCAEWGWTPTCTNEFNVLGIACRLVRDNLLVVVRGPYFHGRRGRGKNTYRLRTTSSHWTPSQAKKIEQMYLFAKSELDDLSAAHRRFVEEVDHRHGRIASKPDSRVATKTRKDVRQTRKRGTRRSGGAGGRSVVGGDD